MKIAIQLIPRCKNVNSMAKQVNNSASRGIPNILITLKKQKNYIAKQLATKKKLEKQREKGKKKKQKNTKINDK